MMLRADANNFLLNAIKIAKLKGTHNEQLEIMGNETSGFIYEDEIILIKISDDDLWGEIERKINNNILYMKYNGEIIRFDSEFIFLDEHINELLQGLHEKI